MPLAKTYNPQEIEPRIQAFWQEQGTYQFDPDSAAPVYSIDTPPATVSGSLHLGHLYSYSHPDFIARFWRMNGRNVYYPMGFDDNGLPTERLVEKRLGLSVHQDGRTAFIQKCLELSRDVEQDYQAIWQRLGLSIDWRYTYRTIDEHSRRLCQQSFIDLYRRGLAYRREAPAIWCPECQASFAQADLNDLDRQSEFVTLAFGLPEGGSLEAFVSLPIATTRPELLPACVAVFVHPDDPRYQHLIARAGQEPRSVIVPLFGQSVPILADPAADPQKGTGAVMCCTFGDTTDISWWYTHHLPVIQAIDRAGRMTSAAGTYAGLPLAAARQQIKAELESRGLLLARQLTAQSVRVHERCDTPVEYLLVKQWFVRVLDFKSQLLQAGEKIHWHPASMHARYQAWVENLNWDWCLSRQRFYGPVIPVWYCQACGETILADESQLPVDPSEQMPAHPCPQCGGTAFTPEQDVFDTWATSALSPQIAGQAEFTLGKRNGLASEAKQSDSQDSSLPSPHAGQAVSLAVTENKLYNQVFPYSLRPQAHEIIRTWAFYTIVKSLYHWDALPWENVLISGWGIAGEGMGKISKSRGGGPMPPLEMIDRYSADAVRYWAASTAPGKDAIISEEKIQMGARLANKLWNVARFAERFISGDSPHEHTPPGEDTGNWGEKGGRGDERGNLSPADRWILSRLQKLVRRTTTLLQEYDYAAAKSEIEAFFWTELADNYLEMAKQRLYDPAEPTHAAACFSLQTVLLTVLKLFAPFLPYVTEAIYQGLGVQGSDSQGSDDQRSIHRESWPMADPALEEDAAESLGQTLVEIATAVRRFKSERSLPLGAELNRVQLAAVETAGPDAAESLLPALRKAVIDLKSITRAHEIVIGTPRLRRSNSPTWKDYVFGSRLNRLRCWAIGQHLLRHVTLSAAFLAKRRVTNRQSRYRGCPQTTVLSRVTATCRGEAVRNTPPVVSETSFALLFGQPSKPASSDNYDMTNTSDITLRLFQPADQAVVKDLILAGLAEHWGTLDPSKNPDLNDIAVFYATTVFLVAWSQGQIIGTGALVPRQDSTAEVVRMSVAANWRRQGIGRHILHALVERARQAGFQRLILETTETWQEVIAFYLRFGFHITHYQDGDVYFELTLVE